MNIGLHETRVRVAEHGLAGAQRGVLKRGMLLILIIIIMIQII